MPKPLPIVSVKLQRMAGGGQVLGELAGDAGVHAGKKVFVWGGLPGEQVRVQLTKLKSSLAEGVVVEVLKASASRVVPRDPDGFLSTSPWQIMAFADELQYKQQLVAEAFELHKLALPGQSAVAASDDVPGDDSVMYSDGRQYGYRNKVEFSWWWTHAGGEAAAGAAGASGNPAAGQLDLAFYKRGSHGRQPVEGTGLARPEINRLALAIRDLLRAKGVGARSLKTLLIRCDRGGACVWQLYLKDEITDIITAEEAAALPAQGGELIYSDPRSPASRITKRLAAYGDVVLHDELMGVPFSYACEGFFQVNLPVYEQALRDMRAWLPAGSDGAPGPLLDMYSGVGSIGLTLGGNGLTLVEVDQHAFRELERNVASRQAARPELAAPHAVLAASEKALEYIDGHATVIVDPPRAGLHQAVVDRLLETAPRRIIYLSCNPVTQARDVALLAGTYDMVAARGYNFFPRTPHIEHLVVLQKRVAA